MTVTFAGLVWDHDVISDDACRILFLFLWFFSQHREQVWSSRVDAAFSFSVAKNRSWALIFSFVNGDVL